MSRTSAVNQIVRSLSIPNNDLSSNSSPTQYEEGSEWGDGSPLPSLLQSRGVKSLLLNIPDLCFVRE